MSNTDKVEPEEPGSGDQGANPYAVPPLPALEYKSPERKAYTASHFQIHTWGATGISYYFQYQLFAQVSLIFNLGFGMDPRVIGWALFFPRLIDAFLDPVIGHFSDILKTPWGRRRPFMVVCSVLAAGLGWALWQANPGWPWWGQFMYLCVLVTAYFIVVMTFELTRNALSYELSDDYNIRSTIMAIASFWSALPQVLGGAAVYWFVVELSHGGALTIGPGSHPFFSMGIPNLGSEVAGIRAVSVVVGVIVIVFAIIPTMFIKERFQNYNTKHVPLWMAFKATLKNKTFVVTIMLRLAQTLGSVLYGTMGSYIIIYEVCRGDKAQFAAIMAYGGAWLGLFVNIVIWPLAAPLTKLIGKRWGLILGFGSALVQAIIAPFLMHPGWIWVLFFNNLFWMPFGMMQGVFFSSIQPDICDVDELTSGERREGLYSAVYSFINKLEISVVILLSGYMLVWSGFDTKSASKNILPSHEVIVNMMWLGFTPLIFFAAMAFVFTFFNPLTPEAMAKVHAELEERRAAGGIATNPA